MTLCTNFERERKHIRDQLEQENKQLTLKHLLSFDKTKSVTKLVSDKLISSTYELFVI